MVVNSGPVSSGLVGGCHQLDEFSTPPATAGSGRGSGACCFAIRLKAEAVIQKVDGYTGLNK